MGPAAVKGQENCPFNSEARGKMGLTKSITLVNVVCIQDSTIEKNDFSVMLNSKMNSMDSSNSIIKNKAKAF